MKKEDPTHQLSELANRLELPFSPQDQDWGIEHSDPSRLGEFIEVYEHGSLTEAQRYWLYELIVSSANDGLAEGVMTDSPLSQFRAFLKAHALDVPVLYEYWSRLNGEEFPVGDVMRGRAG